MTEVRCTLKRLMGVIVAIAIASIWLDANAAGVPASAPDADHKVEAGANELAEMIKEQNALLAQLQHQIDVLPPGDPSRARKLLALAEIKKRIRQDSRRRYISPGSLDEAFADYYHALEWRIEDRGTNEFPTSDGHRLYGDVVLNLTVDSQGGVVETEIVHSSQSRVLDQKAVAIVRSAAPFGRFSDKMLEKADQIVVTSHFHFVHDVESKDPKATNGSASGASSSSL